MAWTFLPGVQPEVGTYSVESLINRLTPIQTHTHTHTQANMYHTSTQCPSSSPLSELYHKVKLGFEKDDLEVWILILAHFFIRIP